MTTMFRLLDLPLLPLKRIIEGFTPLEIFEFSLCSERCENLVKYFHPKISFVIRFDAYESMIMFFYPSGILHWYFNDERSEDSENVRTMSGVQMKFWKEKEDASEKKWWKDETVSTTPVDQRQSEVLVKTVLDRFLDLFDCYCSSIYYHTSKIPSNLSNLLERIHQSDQIVVRGGVVYSGKHVDVLMSKITRRLVICGPVERGFQPASHLKLVSDEVETSGWITRQMFLEADCVRLIISSKLLTFKDCEELVFNWFHSNNQRLEYIRVQGMRFDSRRVAQNRINLKRFGGKPWDPQVRDQYYPKGEYGPLDLSKGVDIVRSDGVLATVLYNRNSFVFAAWHQ